ncbi:hypothetical protein WCLP8_800002 [uncultured Gammaproteobacteria bacterium]
MSDNEQAAAPLRDSEVLSVNDTPRPSIPDPFHLPEEGGEIPSAVAGQCPGHVFPDEPAGAESINHVKGDEGQVTTRIIQASSLSGNRERLAGAAECEQIDILNSPPVHGGDIAEVRDTGKVRPVNGRRERIDLGGPAPVDAGTGALGRADPGKEGAAAHGLLLAARLAAALGLGGRGGARRVGCFQGALDAEHPVFLEVEAIAHAGLQGFEVEDVGCDLQEGGVAVGGHGVVSVGEGVPGAHTGAARRHSQGDKLII